MGVEGCEASLGDHLFTFSFQRKGHVLSATGNTQARLHISFSSDGETFNKLSPITIPLEKERFDCTIKLPRDTLSRYALEIFKPGEQSVPTEIGELYETNAFEEGCGLLLKCRRESTKGGPALKCILTKHDFRILTVPIKRALFPSPVRIPLEVRVHQSLSRTLLLLIDRYDQRGPVDSEFQQTISLPLDKAQTLRFDFSAPPDARPLFTARLFDPLKDTEENPYPISNVLKTANEIKKLQLHFDKKEEGRQFTMTHKCVVTPAGKSPPQIMSLAEFSSRVSSSTPIKNKKCPSRSASLSSLSPPTEKKLE